MSFSQWKPLMASWIASAPAALWFERAPRTAARQATDVRATQWSN